MISTSSVLLRPPFEVGPLVMYIVAVALCARPFKVAVTVSTTVPAVLPAVNSVEGVVPLDGETEPYELLNVHE
jgi:hypothetical protein